MGEKRLPLAGTLIKRKAIQFAAALGHHDFQANNGWIDKFKKRHHIVQKVISGGSASVIISDCEHWKQNVLNEIFNKCA